MSKITYRRQALHLGRMAQGGAVEELDGRERKSEMRMVIQLASAVQR